MMSMSMMEPKTFSFACLAIPNSFQGIILSKKITGKLQRFQALHVIRRKDDFYLKRKQMKKKKKKTGTKLLRELVNNMKHERGK